MLDSVQRTFDYNWGRFPGLDVFHVIVPTFSKYYGNTLQAKVDFYYNTF